MKVTEANNVLFVPRVVLCLWSKFYGGSFFLLSLVSISFITMESGGAWHTLWRWNKYCIKVFFTSLFLLFCSFVDSLTLLLFIPKLRTILLFWIVIFLSNLRFFLFVLFERWSGTTSSHVALLTIFLCECFEPTFCTIKPISAGIFPFGTSKLVRIFISCFSPPEGYLVGMTLITISLFNAAFCSAFIASGLLSSIPIMVSFGLRICSTILIPWMISSACCYINGKQL